MKWTTGVFVALAAMFFATDIQASAVTPGQSAAKPAMMEFAKARPPIGYVQFCTEFPADCQAALPQKVALTEQRWAELNEINDTVNITIKPVTDEELYHEEERWTYPVTEGDCEDYVLLKRRMLMERGWSAANLLITVVRDQRGDGHAVLTVRTEQGDLILDNQVPEIRYWSQTDYRFEKRQSSTNPTGWVWLRGDRGGAQIVSAF